MLRSCVLAVRLALYRETMRANADKKAFICNRVGDFGFLIGILTLWALTNTLDFSLMEIPAGISGR